MIKEPQIGELYMSAEDINFFTSLETIERGQYCTAWVDAGSILLLVGRERIVKPYFEMTLSLFFYEAKLYIFTESFGNKDKLFEKFFKPFTS